MKLNFNHWYSFKTRLTILSLVISVISICVLTLYSSRLLQYDMQRQLGEQQRSTVSYVATTLNFELEERIEVLNLSAKAITPAMLKNPASVQRYLDQQAVLHFHFNGGYFVLSKRGIVIADSPLANGRVGVDFMERKYARGALKDGKATVGDPVMGKALKAPVFSIAVPVSDGNGKVIAALVGTTDLGRHNFLDKITDQRYSKTGGYVLIAPEVRTVITATDKSRIMQQLPASGVNAIVDRHINGYEGTDVYTNPPGVEVLGSAKNIPVAGWYVVATLPTAEAFAAIRDLQHRLLMAAFAFVLLTCVLVWLMLKRQFNQIWRLRQD